MTDPIKCELHIGDAVFTLDEVELRRDVVEVGERTDSDYVRLVCLEPLRLRAVVADRKPKEDEPVSVSLADAQVMAIIDQIELRAARRQRRY